MPGLKPRLRFCPSASFLPGRLFPHTKPQRTRARCSALPWADHHSAKGRLGIIPELVLGGRSMGFSPCRSPRSSPPHRRAITVSCRVLLVGVTELVLGGPRESPLWEGEAPAETRRRRENETRRESLCASASLRAKSPHSSSSDRGHDTGTPRRTDESQVPLA